MKKSESYNSIHLERERKCILYLSQTEKINRKMPSVEGFPVATALPCPCISPKIKEHSHDSKHSPVYSVPLLRVLFMLPSVFLCEKSSSFCEELSLCYGRRSFAKCSPHVIVDFPLRRVLFMLSSMFLSEESPSCCEDIYVIVGVPLREFSSRYRRCSFAKSPLRCILFMILPKKKRASNRSCRRKALTLAANTR